MTTTEGPLLVLAGAGTGKTRVVTTRIAHLLHNGVQPETILAMTFTNKAAGEMRERLKKMVGSKRAKLLTIGTFHAFCVRSLRKHAEVIGLPTDFVISDGSDQLMAMKGVLRELRVPEARMHPRAALARVSLLKNRLVSAESAVAEAAADDDVLVAEAFERYQKHLRRSRSIDFDDLLVEMVRLLTKHEGLRGQFRRRFRYVHVDEYQDTNGPQYEIVHQIAGEHRNLCVVGDDDQSIYGWRGADVRKILEFERHFVGAVTVRLETNYRSTAQILDAANAVICNNPSRHEKTLRSALGDGPPVTIECVDDEEAEARFVVRKIHGAIERRVANLRDFAVLVRTANQPRAFEAAFRARGIPYVLVGGQSFFDRKEVRDVLAFLKLVANPDDEVSLLRIINTPPRGVGKTSIDRALAYATEQGISINKAFEQSEKVANLQESAVRAVAGLRAKLLSMTQIHRPRRVVDLVRGVLEAVRYRDEIDRCYPEQDTRDTRWASVEEVVNFAENYQKRTPEPTLAGFLEELSLSANDDRSSDSKNNRDAVTIMTLHAAKGLEFPRVFLVGVEEGTLPHKRSAAEDTIEEERRLMYVGVTRAQRQLWITHTRARAKFGRRVQTHASRFIYEIMKETPPRGWLPAGAPPVAATAARGKGKGKGRPRKPPGRARRRGPPIPPGARKQTWR